MELDTILSTLIGVAVSVLLFLAGYRQTVGAKKERVTAANQDLERTMIKRIVLEEYLPTHDELRHVIAAKARDYRVQSGDLVSTLNLIETVFLRLLESDFIAPDKRIEIRLRLAPLWRQLEPDEDELREEDQRVPARQFLPLVIAMAAAASALGSVVGTFPQVTEILQSATDRRLEDLITSEWVLVFLSSLAALAGVAVIFRFREMTERGSRDVPLRSSEFEFRVAKAFKDAGFTVEVPKGPAGFDFLAVRGGHRLVVEVKKWLPNTPPSRMSSTVRTLLRSVEKHGATRAVLVSDILPEMAANVPQDDRLYYVTFAELVQWVRSLPILNQATGAQSGAGPSGITSG